MIGALWLGFATAASLVVAVDHGPALVAVGGSRRALLRETVGHFRRFRRDVFDGHSRLAPPIQPAARLR